MLCKDRPQISAPPGSARSVWLYLPLLSWCSGVLAVISVLQFGNLLLNSSFKLCPCNWRYFSCGACSVFFSFSSLDSSASKDSLSDKSSPQSPDIWFLNGWEAGCEEYKDIGLRVCVILLSSWSCIHLSLCKEPCTWYLWYIWVGLAENIVLVPWSPLLLRVHWYLWVIRN